MSELVCYNCGASNSDPGGVLDTYECGQCGQRTLVRSKTDKTGQALVGGIIGIALGASLLGAPGMLLGAVVGGIIGWRIK